MNWKELTLISDYQESLLCSDKRVLKSQLIRLMMHIIKWIIQPQYRSRSWLLTIENARIEIEGLLEEEPHLKPEIDHIWIKCFNQATRLAQKETGIKSNLSELSWNDVFTKDYNL